MRVMYELCYRPRTETYTSRCWFSVYPAAFQPTAILLLLAN